MFWESLGGDKKLWIHFVLPKHISNILCVFNNIIVDFACIHSTLSLSVEFRESSRGQANLATEHHKKLHLGIVFAWVYGVLWYTSMTNIFVEPHGFCLTC